MVKNYGSLTQEQLVDEVTACAHDIEQEEGRKTIIRKEGPAKRYAKKIPETGDEEKSENVDDDQYEEYEGEDDYASFNEPTTGIYIKAKKLTKCFSGSYFPKIIVSVIDVLMFLINVSIGKRNKKLSQDKTICWCLGNASLLNHCV